MSEPWYEDDGAVVSEPMDHVGYMAHRVYWPSGDLERAFAFQWLERNRLDPAFLGMLLDGGDEDQPISPRDIRVAATIIQWLGTNVGFSMILAVFKQAGYTITEEVRS